MIRVNASVFMTGLSSIFLTPPSVLKYRPQEDALTDPAVC